MEELQTQRLRICAFDKRYLEDYALYLTEEITRYQYPDPFASLEDAEALLDGFLADMARGKMLELAVLSLAGTFLGAAEVFGLQEEKPELGLWLRADAHGQGLGAEVMRAVLGWLKQQGYAACIYEVDRRNAASIALVKKFGGRPVGFNEVKTPSGKQLLLETYEIAL